MRHVIEYSKSAIQQHSLYTLWKCIPVPFQRAHTTLPPQTAAHWLPPAAAATHVLL